MFSGQMGEFVPNNGIQSRNSESNRKRFARKPKWSLAAGIYSHANLAFVILFHFFCNYISF